MMPESRIPLSDLRLNVAYMSSFSAYIVSTFRQIIENLLKILCLHAVNMEDTSCLKTAQN